MTDFDFRKSGAEGVEGAEGRYARPILDRWGEVPLVLLPLFQSNSAENASCVDITAMNTQSLIFSVLYLLVSFELTPAHAQVPSLINYQGRLSDANGAPVTGSKNFVIRLYDAQTGGTLLYTEDLGSVSLGTNGIYSFQFGSAGSSNAVTSEAVATTNGTATTFQKVLSSSPVVTGSVSVSDGTYTWSEAAGSSDEQNFGVSYASSLGRVTVNYYSAPPASGRNITATYRAVTTGISGAITGVGEHWMELSVNGTLQAPRTRLLAVPFSLISKTSDLATSALTALSAPTAEAQAANAQETAEMALVAAETAKANIAIGQTSGSWSEFFTHPAGNYNSITLNNFFVDADDFKATERIVVFQNNGQYNWGPFNFFPNAPVRMIQNYAVSTSSSQYGPSLSVNGTIYYADGSEQQISLSNGFGYYSSGQSRTMTAIAEKPNLNVTKVTLSGRVDGTASSLITLWVNSPRTLECKLPDGFIASGFEYKLLPTFETVEQNASYLFQLLDLAGVSTDVPSGQWFQRSSAAKVRFIVNPANSTSDSVFTVPKGVVLIKRKLQ